MVLRKSLIWTTLVFVPLGGLGCGGKPTDRPAPTVSIPAKPSNESSAKPGTTSETASLGKIVSFAEAVTETSPEDQQPPPDQTLNGLSTGKVREQVQQVWNQIAFQNAQGKRIYYSALIETEFGTAKIDLLPELAPNHVRNFVALAKAGYYNGLLFENVLQQQGDEPNSKLELVEAGCPQGTGEPGIGHLGYWLKPEFSESLVHEEGMVGACLSGGSDTAGCRFYITLSKAPVMDGNFTIFGKISSGLDVVRTIAKQPRAEGMLRPERPTVIRALRIETREEQ